MTKQAKMITAVVAAVVVVAGGLGLYLKGGDLMGRMRLKRLPAYDEQQVCEKSMQFQNIYFYYSGGGTTLQSYKYASFSDLVSGLQSELALYNGKTVCPYRVVINKKVTAGNETGYLLVNCDSVEVSGAKLICNAQGFTLELTEQGGFLEGEYVVSGSKFNLTENLVPHSSNSQPPYVSVEVTTVPPEYVN